MNEIKTLRINLLEAITQSLDLREFNEKSCQADILRIDKIHPIISGNKWFKLKYNIESALEQKCNTILTFGGAYSNHIIAVATLANELGLKSIGIIRGEEPRELSHTLKSAKENAMQLNFISREDFKNRSSENYYKSLVDIYGDFYLIPEGGASAEGRKGTEEILSLVNYKKYSHIMCSIGTGTMYIGVVNSSEKEQQIIGIPALKGMVDLLDQYSLFIKEEKKDSCKIFYDYHFGGYAKKNPELINFMNYFFEKNNIPTDFVYTAKLLYAFYDLLKKDYFPKNSKILIIHSGGLQGNISLPANTLNF
ncbi:MAG: 1-aminocyclopropane-1-carboxylate deaminase/D-cysteine desulfhydrase [Candidatus Sericytochromatia bacterium]|nr:1-aminocyclopropane-1-carboxylate deaminase/D-cysteine desulfhydrase [Candidatus Sericytochromatia bacterium]